MPGIQISGTFKKGTLDQGSFAIIRADSLLIPIQLAADINARNAMYEYLRMPYMLCYVITENKTYRLGSNITIAGQVWTLETEDYIPLTQKGAANGVPPLNAEGKIPVEYLDALYLSSAFVVTDIPAMLALTTYKGNLVVVEDASADPAVPSGSATYAKINDVASPTLADFLKMEFGVSVVSVNGLTGAVSIDFDKLLTYGASQTQFTAAVSTNVTVLQNVADIITANAGLVTLDNIKANKDNVLELDNSGAFTPTEDYHPSTKKYVDWKVSSNVIVPLGPEGSIQINESNILNGYANFTYIGDRLTVPEIKLSTDGPVNNDATWLLVRDPADGLIKLRSASTISGSGTGSYLTKIIIQNGHGFDKDFIFYDGSTWVKARADVAANCATHFAININVSSFELVPIGEIDSAGFMDFEGNALTISSYYFLSQTVAGKVTGVKPGTGITQSLLITNEANKASISIQEPYDIEEEEEGSNPIRIVTADYTAVRTDYTILMDGTSNTVTVSLRADPLSGTIVNVKCINATFTCDIAGNGKNIDGSASNIVLNLTDSLSLQYDSTYGWAII